MTKKEVIWRHILHQALTRQAPHQNKFGAGQTTKFTQKELAASFGFSLSTVFNALRIPRKIGAVEVTGRFFRVRDPEKFLYIWATHRNLKRDILYATHSDLPALKIESAMPPRATFGAFSAYRLAHKDAPADYSVVYVYSTDLSAIKKRFPPKKGYPNLFVLKPDPYLSAFGHTTPDVQTFVDLWNIPEWYAKDFLDALKEKMRLT